MTLDVPTGTEVMLSVTALALYIAVFRQGVWFLGVSLLAFGGLSLKSMNLSHLFAIRDAQLRYGT